VRAGRVFESILYVDDLAASEKFYTDVLGLELIYSSDILLAFRCDAGVLLVFDRKLSVREGRTVPSHGTKGEGHIAFAAGVDELDAWRAHLAAKGVEIEREVDWEVGGVSLYFRDPDGNSIELAPPTLWGGGWDF
jgi:catechol 2,3-dioxygenase-like lactoylglutathione lyase family enzyme